MSKSHKEVLAYFKSQRDALNQLVQLFPDQAAHAESMLERLNAVQSCMSLSAERLSRIQVGLDEMHEMETGMGFESSHAGQVTDLTRHSPVIRPSFGVVISY